MKPAADFYYCDVCMRIHGRLTVMDLWESEDGINSFHMCPVCGEKWKVNQGQARHKVADELRKYLSLAVDLDMDIVEIVYECMPQPNKTDD